MFVFATSFLAAIADGLLQCKSGGNFRKDNRNVRKKIYRFLHGITAIWWRA
jgi:hypothetical protein